MHADRAQLTRLPTPWQHDGSAHQQPNATDPPPATTRHNATSSAHAAPPSPRNPAATTSRNHERNAGNDEPGTPPTGRNGFPSADPRQPAHDRPTYHTDPSPGRNPRTDTTDTEPTDTAHLLTKERKPRTDQTAAGRQSSTPQRQGVPQYGPTLAPACPGYVSETRPTYRAGGPLQGAETRPTLNTNPAAVSSGAGGPGQAGAG